MSTLSPQLRSLGLSGLERWRYFSQGVITYPTMISAGKKAASPRTPRRRAGPQTSALHKLAAERETFTLDDLPQFDRRLLASRCEDLVRKGELRLVQKGTPGRNGTAAVYSRNKSPKDFPAAFEIR